MQVDLKQRVEHFDEGVLGEARSIFCPH